jgi:hypothetical protein
LEIEIARIRALCAERSKRSREYYCSTVHLSRVQLVGGYHYDCSSSSNNDRDALSPNTSPAVFLCQLTTEY